MSYITACVDVVDSTGARALLPNANGAYQPFRIKLPAGSIVSCSDRGDGTSEVSIDKLGSDSVGVAYWSGVVLQHSTATELQEGNGIKLGAPALGVSIVTVDSAAVIKSSGDGRRIEQYGAVLLTASPKTFAFTQAADVKSKTEINATIVGGTGVLDLLAGSLPGDRLLLRVTFSAGDHLIVTRHLGSAIIDETASAAGTRTYLLVFTAEWQVWSVAGNVRVNNAPCHSIATGGDFPVAIANGIATLDPGNLLMRALWRERVTMSYNITTDAATVVASIPSNLPGLTEPLTAYAALISSRIVVRMAGDSNFAFIDIMCALTLATDTEGFALFTLAPGVEPSVTVNSIWWALDPITASVSVSDGGYWVRVNVTRPPGVECIIRSTDTAILELQEIA